MKYLFSILLLLLAGTSRAEIMQMQLKVIDGTPILMYRQFTSSTPSTPLTPEGGFDLSSETSNMVPVKNQRIVGFRMPFIYNKAHEVLLVGPYLDLCGDIQILDENNGLLAVVRTSAFIGKGKRNFFIQRHDVFRSEGYVHFRIPESVIRTIGRRNFKIKVGPVDDKDIVECKIVNRYTAEAILFTGDRVPTREAIQGGAHVRHNLTGGVEYEVKIKIRGGSAGEEFQFNNGKINEVLYHVRGGCRDCEGTVLEGRGPISRARLLAENDAITFKVRSYHGRFTRNRGDLIAIADAGAGNWMDFTPDRDEMFAPGRGPLREDAKPEGWGPYLFMREAPDLYRFGQYTDLYEINSDKEPCICPTFGSGSSSTRQIISTDGGGNGGGGAPVMQAPATITLALSNAFVFTSSNSNTVSDDFGGLANVCPSGSETVPKISVLSPLTVSITSNTARTGLTARFRRGTTVLATVSNISVAAGSTSTAAFNRPENRLATTRSNQNAAVCKRAGNGIGGVPHWDDEGIVIEVLQGNTVLQTITVPTK
ncbi:hypothetical protein [Flaviaesturariibacter amylovorans]|uniref:Uncharacterized protein n=1 Tax=Flaviaesturariibacter amylovorans TaxID=1084520 RepID=A0ABP8HFX5_9BACT